MGTKATHVLTDDGRLEPIREAASTKTGKKKTRAADARTAKTPSKPRR
jgi:hypothetical protein